MAMNKPSPKDQTTPDKSLACRPTSACPAPSTPARGRLEAGAALKLYRSSFAPSWFQPSFPISRFLLSKFPLGRSPKPPVAFAQTIPAPAATRVGSSSPQASREELSCHPQPTRRLAGRLRATACVGRAQAPAKPPSARTDDEMASAATRVGSCSPQTSREEPSCHPQPTRRLAGRLRPTACVGRAQAPAKPPVACRANHPAPAATRVGSSSPRASRETPLGHSLATKRLAGRLRPTIFVFFVSSWSRAFPHPKTTAGDGPFRRKQPNRRNRCFRSQDMDLTNLSLKEQTMSEKIQICRLAGQRIAITLGKDGQGPWSNLAGN